MSACTKKIKRKTELAITIIPTGINGFTLNFLSILEIAKQAKTTKANIQRAGINTRTFPIETPPIQKFL